MKVNDPTRPARVKNIQRAGEAKKTRTAPTAKAPSDAISVMGVPESELTPNVRAALISLIEDIRLLREELKQARDHIGELETLADRDPLLDIFNRRAFARELDRALGMIDRYQMRASLVFIDLNDLKKINDALGHAAGDAALIHVAKKLTVHVRQTDVVARLGGDEFAILLLQADESIAAAKATAIAQFIAAEPVDWEGAPFSVAVSWGAAAIDNGASAQEIMNRADEAMYEAKKRK